MDANRKMWNEHQRTLRTSLLKTDQYPDALEILKNQHKMVHRAEMSQTELWSFEDELWQGLDEEIFRTKTNGNMNTIAWHIWHITRIEDMTMNLLIAGEPQIINGDNWLEQMQVTVCDTGNTWNEDMVKEFSLSLNIEALQAYRLAVGRRTTEIISRIQPEQMKQRVEPSRLERIMSEGAVTEEARWLIDYWSKRNFAGLFLMPATRHNFVHLNKSMRIRERYNK